MDIYYFNITPLRNKIVFANAIEVIDKYRREKVEILKQTDDKLRCVGAGLLLEHIKKVYEVTSDIVIDRYGKPSFQDNKVCFNISHSGNFVVAVVSDKPIGIDIQRVKADKHKVAEKNFLPEECNYINKAFGENELMERFCQVWTVKEAYLKKIGIGLRKPLKSFKVDMNGEMPIVEDDIEGKVIQFKLDNIYIISVCSHISDDNVQVHQYNFS